MRTLISLTACATIAMAASIPVHGHRGARTVLPENTIPAFEYAIQQGADWIELDLWVTKDNVLVVAHDPEMNPKICRGPQGAERLIRKMTLSELRRWDCGLANPEYPRQKAVPNTRVPTFDEVLELAKKYKTFRFNVEIKSNPQRPELSPRPDEYARMTASAIRRRKLGDRVMIQSFDWRVVRAFAQVMPDWPRSALFPVGGADKTRNFVDIAKDANVKMVSVQYDTVTPEKVKQAHGAGIRVVAWTANSPEVWERLTSAGVDEIITDDPAALIAFLKSRKLHN